jgi:quinol monooxygenase YgiN
LCFNMRTAVRILIGKPVICQRFTVMEKNASSQDTCCTIAPYFTVSSGKLPEFKKLCEQFVAKTRQEAKCLYYGFSFCGDEVHCREGYQDAGGLLEHLENVGPLLEEALKISKITRLEVHGPEGELAKLREPLAKLNPQFFTLAYGFRRQP